MLIKSPLARLVAEDLNLLHGVVSRYEAVELNPRAYSAAETERIVLQYNMLMSEFTQRYELPDMMSIVVCKWTGLVWNGDEENG